MVSVLVDSMCGPLLWTELNPIVKQTCIEDIERNGKSVFRMKILLNITGTECNFDLPMLLLLTKDDFYETEFHSRTILIELDYRYESIKI